MLPIIIFNRRPALSPHRCRCRTTNRFLVVRIALQKIFMDYQPFIHDVLNDASDIALAHFGKVPFTGRDAIEMKLAVLEHPMIDGRACSGIGMQHPPGIAAVSPVAHLDISQRPTPSRPVVDRIPVSRTG